MAIGQHKPLIVQVLASFPDLADVIEIAAETKAQHNEMWGGQVGIFNLFSSSNLFVLNVVSKAPSKRALPLLAIVLAKYQVKMVMLYGQSLHCTGSNTMTKMFLVIRAMVMQKGEVTK